MAQLLTLELALAVLAVAQIETPGEDERPTARPVESTLAEVASEVVHVKVYALPPGLVLTVATIRTD
jgi:hypothetical protein